MRYVVLVDIGRGSSWVRPAAECISAAKNLYRSYPTREHASQRAAFLGSPPYLAFPEDEAARLLRSPGAAP
jgi:hypothetical protein